MRKYFFLFLLFTLPSVAVERVTFDELSSDWNQYIGKTVEISTPLYLCGNYYDSLVLAPERLYAPEEVAIGLAEGDSSVYYRTSEYNLAHSISLQCKVYNYKVRTGAYIRNLRARVTAPHKLLTGKTPSFKGNNPEKLPRLGKTDMTICAANIQNYFYHLGGYATKRTTREQQQRQTLKIAKALTHINADIYALCEVERGTTAADTLVAAMNKMAGKDCYAWINNGFTDADMIMCCYVYRKDHVRPYGETQFAYADTTGHYHYREMARGFEHIATGEHFILNINHLRSKHGTSQESNAKRNVNIDSLFVMLPTLNSIFGDEDILMVGDYNCYTYEEPIQRILKAGYKDMLPTDNEGKHIGYSYVFRSEMGYLDRVFASPTMSTQITAALPYHVNADYFYSRGYKSRYDKTMYRYSDHDPILIGIKFKK